MALTDSTFTMHADTISPKFTNYCITDLGEPHKGYNQASVQI